MALPGRTINPVRGRLGADVTSPTPTIVPLLLMAVACAFRSVNVGTGRVGRTEPRVPKSLVILRVLASHTTACSSTLPKVFRNWALPTIMF
ncbi:hypothetical protein U9R71_26555 [Bacillus toyonensis]|nr:hypothetical protein [Bacillus toyonensis]